MKSLEEYGQMVKALTAWFKSQDIDPKDAGVVMMQLTAKLMVEATTDTKLLSMAININAKCIAVEIAHNLRERMKQ